MSDALTIASYIYPHRPWRESFRELAVYWLNEENDTSHVWSSRSWEDVHDAERELIARGLADEYAQELLSALKLWRVEAAERASLLEDVWRIACAPLEMRARALAAVVRWKVAEDLASVHDAPDSSAG